METSGARRVSGRAARPRHSTRLPTLSLPARVLAGDRYGTRLLGFPACKLQFSTLFVPWLGSTEV